jgi:hypothetical protein
LSTPRLRQHLVPRQPDEGSFSPARGKRSPQVEASIFKRVTAAT